MLLISLWVLQTLGITTLCYGEATGVWGCRQVGAELCTGTKGMAVKTGTRTMQSCLRA